MARVLVVDDEPGIRDSLRMLLAGMCVVETADGVDAALRAMRAQPPDLVLLDLVMPGRSGFELLSELGHTPHAPPVLVLTATRTVSTAVEAMKRGAADYVTKPFEIEALRIKVRQLLEHRALAREVEVLRARVEERDRLGDLLGASAPMREVFETIRRAAASTATVIIRGESGTGKELAARALHALSPRAERPFVAVNCAAIPRNLIESELFGHERGAFTDARERRIGKFEAAAGGTLFLDEIGDLDVAVQAKFLRALEERRIERLGGSEPIEVDVRVLAATHRDLERDVAAGRFRADLFYRIQVVPIDLPPLRERREDVRLLARHFLAEARAQAGRGPERIAAEALAALERFSWPGNVRELRNAIERAVALADGPVLGPEDLPAAIVQTHRIESLGDAVREGRMGFEEATADFERALLLEALELSRWNQTHAAERLRITRRALKLRMDRLGLEPPA
ncbi:MAG: sigma-54 dependent transcriptional regulator [Myxococcales bacterium]|nr:sigma-54 dependent transcriptional regulator [Myxococcales bacterium]MDH5565330.1 sigma-54 dependent transcriptional regulator [Myxococcales bacterium]